MKKYFVIITIIVASGILFLGQVIADDMPGADAKQLWTYITQTSVYKNWGGFPGHEDMHKGKQPHGSFHKIYANKPALESTKPEYKYGSIVLKESYTKDKKFRDITIMYKVKGYDPEHLDWFWAMYDAEGNVKKSGKVEGCIKCHGNVKKQDYVFVHALK